MALAFSLSLSVGETLLSGEWGRGEDEERNSRFEMDLLQTTVSTAFAAVCRDPESYRDLYNIYGKGLLSTRVCGSSW
jgi:hypothetical protein